MATRFDRMAQTATGAQSQAEIDAGLRQYMLGIYNYMATGIALTGLVAFLAANIPPVVNAIYGTPLQWVVMLAPLGFIFFISFRIEKMSLMAAQVTFWLFAAVMGLSLTYIFLVFTGQSIARVFFITTGMFAMMSLFGYTTKKDLTGFGQFLVMGLIGIIIASLVNIFIDSTALQFAVSVLGVLIFAGLTAWDTQRLKEMYVENMGREATGKIQVMGALSLYLNFINMFVMLMQLLGVARE